MALRRIRNYLCLFVVMFMLIAPGMAAAAEYQGQVNSGEFARPWGDRIGRARQQGILNVHRSGGSVFFLWA